MDESRAQSAARKAFAAEPREEAGMKLFTGDNMMMGLLVIYAVICATFLFERNWPKVLYWASAFGITSAVLWGMK